MSKTCFLVLLFLFQLLGPNFSFRVPTTHYWLQGIRGGLRISDSSAQKVLYSTKLDSNLPERPDNLIERTAIFSITTLLATICPNPGQALKKVGFSYANFVEVSKLLLRHDPNTIRDSITGLLAKIIPAFVSNFFREQYAKSPKIICEMSVQWFGFGFLTWLIGPVEPQLTEVTVGRDGSTEIWNSTVKLVECRYLMVSRNSLSVLPASFIFINHHYQLLVPPPRAPSRGGNTGA